MATIDMKDNDHEVGPNGLEYNSVTVPERQGKGQHRQIRWPSPML
jgi:hypothetical protein